MATTKNLCAQISLTDFFDDWPDFRAGKLNKKAIAASETAVMAF